MIHFNGLWALLIGAIKQSSLVQPVVVALISAIGSSVLTANIMIARLDERVNAIQREIILRVESRNRENVEILRRLDIIEKRLSDVKK